MQNDQLNFTFTDTLLLQKVTKIWPSIGDPVGVEVAVAAGDKDTTGTRQTAERVMCPAAVMVPDIQDPVSQVLRQD